MRKLRSSADCACQAVLDWLQTVDLIRWKIVVQRVAIVQFWVNQWSCNCTWCGEVKCITNSTKVSNVIKTRLWQSSDLVVKGQVVVKQYTKTTSWSYRCYNSVSIEGQWWIVELGKLLWSANDLELCLVWVERKQVGRHPGWDFGYDRLQMNNIWSIRLGRKWYV